MPDKRTSSKKISQGLRTAWRSPETIENREFIAGLEKAIFGAPQPQAVDMEAAVLGAILLDKDAYYKVHFLEPNHFYPDKHAIIYNACQQLVEKGLPIDMLMLTEELKGMKKWKISGLPHNHFKTITKVNSFKSALDAIGGPYYLVELTNRIGSSANIEFHARIIYQQYLFREGIRKASRFIGKCYAQEGDVFDLRNDLAEGMLINSPTGYFRIRTWNQVLEDASKQPDMSRLAGELLHKGSITIMFAPPGSGKSIGAVQLGNAIASGRSMFPNILVNELGEDRLEEPQRLNVCFLDMELFDKEVEKRYTKEDAQRERYLFSDNFWRVDPNPEFLDYPEEDVDKFINRQIESIVRQRVPDVLIVDNLTALSSESASDVNVAIRIMRFLKKLRIKYELTILVIGHTTKYGNKMDKLTLSAMKGASAIQDFAPTIFGISENYMEGDSYYLKQLKGRNGQNLYGESNVIKYRIEKQDKMLQWVFDGFATESECLTQFLAVTDQDQYVKDAIAIKIKHWEKGWRTITKELGYPFSHVTLMNKCKEFVNQSTQYEFQGREIVEVKAAEPAEPAQPEMEFPKVENPRIDPAHRNTDKQVEF